MKRFMLIGALVICLPVSAFAVTRGGAGDDRIFGTPSADVLLGGGGDDVVAGRGGDDQLSGGPGADFVFGGEGFDTCEVDADDLVRGCEVRT